MFSLRNKPALYTLCMSRRLHFLFWSPILSYELLRAGVFSLHLYPLPFHNMLVTRLKPRGSKGPRPLTVSVVPCYLAKGIFEALNSWNALTWKFNWAERGDEHKMCYCILQWTYWHTEALSKLVFILIRIHIWGYKWTKTTLNSKRPLSYYKTPGQPMQCVCFHPYITCLYEKWVYYVWPGRQGWHGR